MIGVGHHINWPPLGLALLLALLGAWLNQLGVRVEAQDNAGFTHDPDYFVENFNALAFDVEGRPYQKLSAARMTHYMDDDTTVLDSPSFRKVDPQAPVSVTAKRALLAADSKHLYFLNQVHVERLADDGSPPLTLESEYLHVATDARILHTDKPVILRQGRSYISANELLADDRLRQISMTGNIRGSYERTR